MKCSQCDAEHSEASNFCGHCGAPLGVPLECVQCGFENTRGSSFCTKCGDPLSKGKKPIKGNQRKCGTCGQFNEPDTLFCISCGEEMVKSPGWKTLRQSANPSYKTIVLVIGTVFVFGLLVHLGMTLFKRSGSPLVSSPSIPASTPSIKVDETQVTAVAKNFKCPCGGCGEMVLAMCECDMPRGAVEAKNFIREKLASGFTVEQVIELVDKKYGHRI